MTDIKTHLVERIEGQRSSDVGYGTSSTCGTAAPANRQESASIDSYQECHNIGCACIACAAATLATVGVFYGIGLASNVFFTYCGGDFVCSPCSILADPFYYPCNSAAGGSCTPILDFWLIAGVISSPFVGVKVAKAAYKSPGFFHAEPSAPAAPIMTETGQNP